MATPVIGNALMSAFGNVGNLLGQDAMKGIMDFIGSESFANLVKGGTDLYGATQTSDFMNFQKDLMTKSEGRTQTLFENDQADRTARQNIDWTSGIETPAPYG